MLAVSPVRCTSDNGSSDDVGEAGEFLLDDFDFDDLFVGFDGGGLLPDLDIDPTDIFADFSFTSGEESGNTTAAVGGGLDRPSAGDESRSRGEAEVVSARKKDRKRSASSGSQGKKKSKVDWTPELHRRFVQAVEQLGVNKAVPSRILELMGMDCLTRHNIASHLQKYRSHRKHLLTREAETANWSQRRQMYTGGGGNGGGAKVAVNPNWAAPPIIGFSPQIHQQPFRPLHVWGHPTMEQPQLVPVWPRPPWAAAPRPPHLRLRPDRAYWHTLHYHRPLTQGTSCFPPPLMHAARFVPPPVPGIPPHPRLRPAPHSAVVPSSKHSAASLAQPDDQISNESIDAAIGDVLAKPWLPLPLGLKPPSLESVMVELQKQGVANVPPNMQRKFWK